MPAINLENSTMSVIPVSRRGIMMNAIICYMDKEQIYNALLEMRKALTSAVWAEMMMRVCADLDLNQDLVKEVDSLKAHITFLQERRY